MATYNGHKDWTHWNVSLWIKNDEGLYRMAQGWVRTTPTKADAALRMLQDLNDSGITHTPDGAKYTATNIRAAIREL